jgi:hypothetical protein
LATTITLFEGYPWIDLQKDETLDRGNPYRMMFVAVNEGYAPLTSIHVDCNWNFTNDSGSTFNDMNKGFDVQSAIWHGGKFTVPCTRLVRLGGETIPSYPSAIFMGGKVASADMTIRISYAIMGINFGYLRRTQSFHLITERGGDGALYWEFSGK